MLEKYKEVVLGISLYVDLELAVALEVHASV